LSRRELVDYLRQLKIRVNWYGKRIVRKNW
jgi:hypothetical protein